MNSEMRPREIARYVRSLMRACEPDSVVGRRVGNWLSGQRTMLGLDQEATQALFESGPSHDAWTSLSEAVGLAGQAESPLARNAGALAERVGMGDLDREIFILIALATYDRMFHGLFEQIVETRAADGIDVIAACLETPTSDVLARLGTGPLATMRLVDGADFYPGRFDIYVPSEIMKALRPPVAGIEQIERVLLGSPAETRLAWDDFAHVAAERDFCARLISGAVADRRPGVNLLFYGQPGTGKTELAKVIARSISCDLFSIGEADEEGDEPSRYDRMASLRLGERLSAQRVNAILLFDEMEDVQQTGETTYFGGRRIRRAGSKAFFNRLLETNRVPILWTANALDEFDPAFLRRMSFAFEMKVPPVRVRTAQWSMIARTHSLALPEADAEALARRHRIPPSLAESAVAAVSAARAGPSEIGFVVDRLAKAARAAGSAPARPRPVECDVDLVTTDCDVVALEAGLARPDAPRDVAFCFYGPPGTGKSAFARRLAERMGFDVLEKKASDLLSKWVGETEKLIGEAFEEAASDERFLLIDEAEALFWARSEARASWEVSMVNEFLTAMETHPLPLACTTNHLDRLDPAALRRFAFKVKFEALDPARAALAFQRFFGMDAPAILGEIAGLTPGDFASVRKKLRVLAAADDAGAIVRLLEQEVAVKPVQTRRIGF